MLYTSASLSTVALCGHIQFEPYPRVSRNPRHVPDRKHKEAFALLSFLQLNVVGANTRSVLELFATCCAFNHICARFGRGVRLTFAPDHPGAVQTALQQRVSLGARAPRFVVETAPSFELFGIWHNSCTSGSGSPAVAHRRRCRETRSAERTRKQDKTKKEDTREQGRKGRLAATAKKTSKKGALTLAAQLAEHEIVLLSGLTRLWMNGKPSERCDEPRYTRGPLSLSIAGPAWSSVYWIVAAPVCSWGCTPNGNVMGEHGRVR